MSLQGLLDMLMQLRYSRTLNPLNIDFLVPTSRKKIQIPNCHWSSSLEVHKEESRSFLTNWIASCKDHCQ